MAAALPLCAPSGVAVASHSARPASSSRVTVAHIHSLGRREPSPLPIRIQARTHLRCPKAADCGDHGLEPKPKPKPERGDDKPDAAASTEIPFSYDIPEILELRKFRKAFCDAWLPREAPDMFCVEKDEISNYMRITLTSHVFKMQDVNYKGLSLFVCAEAKEALDLASTVMDLTYTESSDRGTIQLFDQHTTNQVIRMCTPIFCDVAKAAYLKTIETDNVLSFLDALRGLGVFCDMLFLQRVFKLKDGPLKNSISIIIGTHSRNFDKKMKRLKAEFIHSTDAPGMKYTVTNQSFQVMYTLSRGVRHTQSYIFQMIPYWSLSLPSTRVCSSES